MSNTTGIENTAIGDNALTNNAGNNNIAVGANTGLNLFIGSHNIYIVIAAFMLSLVRPYRDAGIIPQKH